MLDPVKEAISATIRDITHNLVITEENDLDNKIYFDQLKEFIILLEGSRNEAYLDGIPHPTEVREFMPAKTFYAQSQAVQDKQKATCFLNTGKYPITTVGIGLNIEPEEVREKYSKIFDKPGLMERVHNGTATLTNEQIGIIFRHSVEERAKELRKIYGADWDKLRANEKIAISSLYFNCPGLANSSTRFRKHIENYVKTGNRASLERAVEEVKDRSNPSGDPGLKNRRNAEAAMLASYECPAYTKPTQSPDSGTVEIAKINSTIIPHEYKGSCIRGINSDFFIWRTQMDPKVRKKHQELEGKIFKKTSPLENEMPGTKNGCRCYAEEVPDHILINDELTKSRAFDLYLRKGITHPILYIR